VVATTAIRTMTVAVVVLIAAEQKRRANVKLTIKLNVPKSVDTTEENETVAMLLGLVQLDFAQNWETGDLGTVAIAGRGSAEWQQEDD
jgi:hypothetical protein